MLDDYYADHPFKERYPAVSRYKHHLEPFYQNLAEEFRTSLTVKKNTVSMLYSIARDFFYHLQRLHVTDLAAIHQEDLYGFLMLEYKDHQGCMNNVTYVLRLICEHFRNKGFQNFPSELMPFSLPPSRSNNYEHLHSGINFITPYQRHYGLDKRIMEIRKETYEKAKAKHPDGLKTLETGHCLNM